MNKTDKRLMSLNDMDNVFLARQQLNKDETIYVNGETVLLEKDIPVGFKLAKKKIFTNEEILKYGYVIGVATADIMIGEIVHFHNIASTYLASTLTSEQKR